MRERGEIYRKRGGTEKERKRGVIARYIAKEKKYNLEEEKDLTLYPKERERV